MLIKKRNEETDEMMDWELASLSSFCRLDVLEATKERNNSLPDSCLLLFFP